MKSVFFVLCVCSSLTTLLAYPVDYNATSSEITRAALSNLRELIFQNDFLNLLQEFNDQIFQTNDNTLEKISSIKYGFSGYLVQLKDSASKVNADVSDCVDNVDLPTSEQTYEKYTEECVNPARALGLNLILLGDNKRTVFYEKYSELMNYFNGCLNGGDPAPHICAGVVEGSRLEVQRVLPAVKANALQIERELKQQISILSVCATEYISILNRRVQTEFDNAKTCVLNKIYTI